MSETSDDNIDLNSWRVLLSSILSPEIISLLLDEDIKVLRQEFKDKIMSEMGSAKNSMKDLAEG